MVGRIGDDMVANALAELARRNPEEAGQARAAFDSLTFGEGVETVTLYGLQYWLWYLLPTKWWTDLTEHRQLAAALGALFDLLELPRYAAACTSETTMQVLTAWHLGRDAGFKSLEKALNASGVQPPDVEGILTWGRVMGVQESDAFQTTAAHLEMAIAAGEFAPGARGWRADAERITGEFLTSPLAPGEQSRLERIHSERMECWATSRGAARARLTKMIAPRIMSPAPIPEDAEVRLAPVRWLLTLAATNGGIAEGAAAEVVLMLHLTEAPNGYFERRAAVAEAMAGEGWHVPAGEMPISVADGGWLIGAIHRRLDLLGLSHRQRSLDDPGDRLTDSRTGSGVRGDLLKLVPDEK
ncbi:hypothetical protein OG320_11020 [Microbispora sp. NBC_01189]|uniref:hypothetical protein n=1 Tax=Microbispora sp. NBC_01189 TaxID=2903583 RepID=UPI002E142C3A|nr:hypothetical protein OG320_11020 [Microbispora sp. NBC_01189]